MIATRAPLAALFLASLAHAQDRHFAFVGEADMDHLGRSVRRAGDVNADGFDDIAVGIYRDDENGFESGTARVYSGLTGERIWEWHGDGPEDKFGVSVAGVGDVDGDQHDDVLVGAYQTGVGPGYARLFSGATGLSIRTFFGENVGDTFGEYVGTAGDVDDDGFPDILVGADDYDNDRGAAYVFSATGALIHAFYGDTVADAFGVSLDGAGDVNGDGHDDIIVGAYLDDHKGSASGRATVFSGATGLVLFAKDGDSAGDHFGISVKGAGDVNNDGFDDFIVGALWDDNNGSNSGSARVFSGVNGAVLYTFLGDSIGDQLGIAVSAAGDVDADGFDDLLVGAYRDDNTGDNSGSARVYSGATGAALFTLNGSAAGDQFGWQVSDLGDVNGDGIPDFAVAAPDHAAEGVLRGQVRVHSGRLLALVSDRHWISLQSGGTQTLSLRAGSTHAGSIYWVFGSITGTKPGIAFNGFTLPLIADAYTTATIKLKNSPVLKKSLGFLDLNGYGTMKFVVPSNSDSELAGLTAFHAYLLYDAQVVPYFASNAVPVTLRP